jgi:hypothetical protein
MTTVSPASPNARVLVGLAVTGAAQAVIDQITSGDPATSTGRMLDLENQPEFQVAVATLESILVFDETPASLLLVAEIDRLLT